jgi:hypothetical protein
MKRKINFDDMRFARVTRAVLNDEAYLTKPVEKLVYSMLCFYADNQTTKSHPSVKTLAAKCCCSENSVRSALRRLEELELIGVTQRKKGNRNYSNEYELYVPPKWFVGDTSNGELSTSRYEPGTSPVEDELNCN